jgi:hypothetical protein
LRDGINFKDGSTSLRNIVKELGLLWKKSRNNRVVLIEITQQNACESLF